MRNFPNIESQSWKRNAYGLPIYVGYGGGETWYIDRSSPRGPWTARPRCAQVRFMPACKRTLAEISNYLAAFDR